MTGSLQTKNGEFFAVLNTKDENGKRKQKWIKLGIPVRGGKREADKALRELISKYENTTNIILADASFSDCVLKWLNHKKEKIEQDTYECYESYVNVHITPYFKKNDVMLSDVQPTHIEKFYAYLHQSGRKDGKGGLQIRTIKKIAVILNGVFDYAMKNNAALRNAARLADLPLDTSPKFKGAFYTIKQMQSLLEAAKGTSIETPVLLAAIYGLRRSEICGLKWSAVDMEKEVIHITDTVVKVKTQIDKNRTKNQASRRELPLLPVVKEHFIQLRKKQGEQEEEQGDCYTVNDYVCKWADGRLLQPEYVSAKFKKLLCEKDLPLIRLHDLRHSAATNLMNMGHNIKDVSRFMGHSNVQTTIDLYCHSTIEDKTRLGTSYTNALFDESSVLEKC